MASKFIILSVTAAVFFGAGCSKNRGWLSRNDYAEMQDPFMEPDSAVAKSSVGKSKASGRASLDNLDPSLAEGQGHTSEPSKISTGTTGPKPIRQAVASHGVTENGRRVAAATYPEDVVEDAPRENGANIQRTAGVTSYSGPALSDFLQKRTAASRAAANQVATKVDELPTRTVSSANVAAQNLVNPAAIRAALPKISLEAESFSNFLTDTSESVPQTGQAANPQVQDTASEARDFVSWAEQKKESNLRAASVARSRQELRQGIRVAPNNTVLAPEIEDPGDDFAMPLIDKRGGPPVAAALSKAKAPAANDLTTAENPFADSFEEFHSSGSTTSKSTPPKPAAPATARSTSNPNSLDDNFRMDTGWKPAHMTRP